MSKKINDITTQVRRGYETTGAGTQVDPQAGGEWTKVDTPFRDRQGERIVFLARKTGKGMSSPTTGYATATTAVSWVKRHQATAISSGGRWRSYALPPTSTATTP